MYIPGWLRPPSSEKRLKRVLRAALRDRYYAGLLPSGSRPMIESFPFSDPEDWLLDRKPVPLPGRIRHPLNLRMIARLPERERTHYGAVAIASCEILNYARVAQGQMQVEFAALILERPGDREVSEAERDELWNALQVPVYRLLVGFDGTLLAHECEALTGLHATADAMMEEHQGSIYVTSLSDARNPSVRLRIDRSAYLEKSPCDCGRGGVRLVPAWREHKEMSSAAD